MNIYIVISDNGWYAKNILQRFPNYKGIDRFPWPLSHEDFQELSKKMTINMKEMEEKDINGLFCDDYDYACRYKELCDLLNINAVIYMCKICSDAFSDNQIKEIEGEEYIFLGYEYVMKDASYSCIIQEKHLIDKIKKISLNENGLFRSIADAQEFVSLRKIANKKNNGNGFELGEDGVDFYIIALFKCK